MHRGLPKPAGRGALGYPSTRSSPLITPEILSKQPGPPLRAIVAEISFATVEHRDPPKEKLDRDRERVRSGIYVFRRAKLDLRGYPQFSEQKWGNPPEASFHLIQYGLIADDKNPDASLRCQPKPARSTGGSILDTNNTRFYLATQDLRRLYEPLGMYGSGAELNLWLINKHLYTETYNDDAEVQLSELRVEFPVHSSPVCMYRLVKSSSSRE